MLVLALFAIYADWATTNIAINRGLAEANPLIALLLKKLGNFGGMWALFALKSVLAILIIVINSWVLSLVIAVAFFIAVTNNIMRISKQKK